MNRYTEMTCKFWPHYNIIVGLSNIAFWLPQVIYWVPPVVFPIVSVCIGIACIYWGIQGIIHHRHMKKLLTKHRQGV